MFIRSLSKEIAYKKKRYITLLEMLISFALSIIILMTLTYFYQEVILVNLEIEKIEKKNFSQLFLQKRLQDIIPKALSKNDPKKDFLFYSSNDLGGMSKIGSSNLLFTFDNCVNLDKAFSNHVLGRLFVDPKDRLIIALWPSPKRWEEGILPPIKEETLLEGVESLNFEFFIPPDRVYKKEEKKKPEMEPEPKGSWVDSWRRDYEQLPAIVKVKIKMEEGEELDFTFPLPNVEKPITYNT